MAFIFIFLGIALVIGLVIWLDQNDEVVILEPYEDVLELTKDMEIDNG